MDSLAVNIGEVGNSARLLSLFLQTFDARKHWEHQPSQPARTGFFEGQHDVTEGGAAGNVMAVYGASRAMLAKKSSWKWSLSCFRSVEWESVQFDGPVEAEADGIADVLMGFAERDALVDEIGGCGHGVEIAGFSGRSCASNRKLRRG